MPVVTARRLAEKLPRCSLSSTLPTLSSTVPRSRGKYGQAKYADSIPDPRALDQRKIAIEVGNEGGIDLAAVDRLQSCNR